MCRLEGALRGNRVAWYRSRYDENIIEGVVVLIEVESTPALSQGTHPTSILEVGWCLEAPTRLAWEEKELEKIRDHDWSLLRPWGPEFLPL